MEDLNGKRDFSRTYRSLTGSDLERIRAIKKYRLAHKIEGNILDEFYGTYYRNLYTDDQIKNA